MKTLRFMNALLAGALLALVSITAQAGALSDYAENKIVDHVFRNTAFSESSPATYYVALNTASCSDSSGGTEVTGGSYARVAISRATSAWKGTHGTVTGASSGTSGTISNAAAITFPAATADWGTVTHLKIMDASSSGNVIVCTALTTSRNITNGSTPSFAIDALTVQIDN
jgi:hypothetical protein